MNNNSVIKQVKCLNNNGFSDKLTIGKVYDVIESRDFADNSRYKLHGDIGIAEWYYQYRFIDVEETKILSKEDTNMKDWAKVTTNIHHEQIDAVYEVKTIGNTVMIKVANSYIGDKIPDSVRYLRNEQLLSVLGVFGVSISKPESDGAPLVVKLEEKPILEMMMAKLNDHEYGCSYQFEYRIL